MESACRISGKLCGRAAPACGLSRGWLKLNFGCQVHGAPPAAESIGAEVHTPQRWRPTNSAMRFAAAAAAECWCNAGFEWRLGEAGPVDWDTAACLGTGVGAVDTVADKVGPLPLTGQVRRLGCSGA